VGGGGELCAHHAPRNFAREKPPQTPSKKQIHQLPEISVKWIVFLSLEVGRVSIEVA